MARTKNAGRRGGKQNDNMSRQPPLPPGLPPRPSYNNTFDGRYSDRPSGRPEGDGYRPRYEEPYRQDQHMSQSYQFRGEPEASSYRPSYDQPRSPPRYDSYSNYPPGGPPPRGPAGDTYRPREPPQDFNFRFEAPSSMNFRQENHRSQQQRSDREIHTIPQPSIEHGYGGRQNNNNNRGNARGGYRGRGGSRKASDREFLKTNRAPTPELMLGMDDDQGNAVKFMRIEDVSDSDEAEMDLSEDENTGDAQQPMKKQARTETKAADGDTVPQWCNPDPYTALPPQDETQRKKKDVVKLIRKARVTSSSENAARTEAVQDDFISFDFGDEDDDDMLAQPQGSGVVGAPTGPKTGRQDTGHDNSHISGSMNQSLPAKPQVSKQQESSRRHGQVSGQEQPLTQSVNANTSRTMLPAKPAAYIDLTTDSDLGNRKRTHRDEIKGPLQLPPWQLINNNQKPLRKKKDGTILQEWVAKPGVTSTPWLSVDHSSTANMGVWLHKEIMDFYHFVKPRGFERFIRTKLVEELANKVQQFFARDGDIRTFGSFPAGLYLPTSDMDLVCVSDQFMRGGRAVFGQADLMQFGRFIKSQQLCANDRPEIVKGAKVPLVKYQDKVTGLRVDVSFENDTGLIANKTFQDWKATFPAMPILVTLIKQLLAMRGLNEPFTGGIGGFSVTCLVTSLLQHMPQVQSGSMIPEHHLGEVLMEFFDLYGNQFNWETTAIELNPPGYIDKARANIPYRASNPVKIAIVDPNRRDNDIAGGSRNTPAILECFSSCYERLQKRMGALQNSANRQPNQSILECILGGDYRSFKLQRDHLAHVHENLFGPIDLAE